jgi:hypothetical protein
LSTIQSPDVRNPRRIVGKRRVYRGSAPGLALVFESEALAVDVDEDRVVENPTSIATVSNPSPAKAESQLPKVRFEVRIVEPCS